MADDAETILARARAARRPPSRALWIASLVVGLLCAGGFAIAMLAPAAPATPIARMPERSTGGFGLGLVVGGVAGVVVGWTLARQRRDHSSRNSP